MLKSFYLLWIFCLYTIYAFNTNDFIQLFRNKRQAKPEENFDVDSYLEKFWYLDELEDDGRQHSEESRSNAIREFQRFANLTVTGKLDKRTVKKMKAKRCGLPDVIKPSDRARSSNPRKQTDPTDPLPFYAPGYKWPKTDITYRWMDYTRQLSNSVQRDAIRKAFSKWSDITPLTFTEVTDRTEADILIGYRRRDHRDGSPFDGNGGTLAHAFFPGDSDIAGDTHFDEDERWTMGVDEGSNLEIVAAHEFGHALGLGHSNQDGALMLPFYTGYDPNYQLGYDDIRGIQSLYGGRRRDPVTRPPVTRPRPTRPRPTQPGIDICTKLRRFDAISEAEDGYHYIFRGAYAYKMNYNRVGILRGYPKAIRKVFGPKAPKKDVGAVVYDRYRRKLFMFKGKKYWRFTRFTLDAGYPKPLNGFYQKVQAVVQWRDGQIYMFKGKEVAVWREDFTSGPPNGPSPISQRWRGLLGHQHAAATYNRETYFFKGSNYVKFDDRYNTVARGYPKPIGPAWLGCGGTAPK